MIDKKIAFRGFYILFYEFINCFFFAIKAKTFYMRKV